MDHSAPAECKGVPAYAVIAMKRTARFCAVNKGGTASALVPYFKGRVFLWNILVWISREDIPKVLFHEHQAWAVEEAFRLFD